MKVRGGGRRSRGAVALAWLLAGSTLLGTLGGATLTRPALAQDQTDATQADDGTGGQWSTIGDSIDHGEEKSAVKNTAPDRRTTRSTSESTSIWASSRKRHARRGNGQRRQTLGQSVAQSRRFG